MQKCLNVKTFMRETNLRLVASQPMVIQTASIKSDFENFCYFRHRRFPFFLNKYTVYKLNM